MNTDLDEALSRLISGDLSPSDAHQLRQRIAGEPEIAAQYREMKELLGGLSSLPEEMEPPPLTRLAPRRPVWPRIVPWVAVAASLLLWIWPSAPSSIVLTEGAQYVEGSVSVLAADREIRVEGRAKIFVEPEDQLMRGDDQLQEDPMNKAVVIAATTGAIVTIAVYQGTATIHDANAATITVAAGEVHRTAATATDSSREVPSDEDPDQTIARLRRDLEQAQADNAQLRQDAFAGALARGQLAAYQGTATEWPSDVPADFTPAHFEAELLARLEGIDDVEIAAVECEEYPCVAALRFLGEGEANTWNDTVGASVRDWATASLGEENLSISVNQSRFRFDDHEARYGIFGVFAAEEHEGVKVRLEHRIDQLVDELGEQSAEEAGE